MTVHFDVSPFVVSPGGDIIPRDPDSNLDLGAITLTASDFILSVSPVVDIEAANGLTEITDPIMIVQGSIAGECIITANPQIVAGDDNGQSLKIIGNDNARPVTFHSGDGLLLENGQPFTVGFGDILNLIFLNSTWLEDSRNSKG